MFINHIQQGSRLKVLEAEDIEKASVSDIFTNIDSVKYFGKEANIKRIFGKIVERTRIAAIKNWNYFRWLDAGQALLIGIATFLIVYFPILKFLDGEITLGTLVFIYTVFGNLMGPIFGFVWGIRNFYRTMADFQDLFQYEKVENDIKDVPNAKKLNIRKGEIEFKNVIFRYKKRKLFPSFNLKIPANKKVAFVGPSGGGKTTLVRLLYRMYDVDKGEILIDGKNISQEARGIESDEVCAAGQAD
jgi:ABC-type transport system involved in Fe-S cluster assembly fused permease/ATPase subunit